MSPSVVIRLKSKRDRNVLNRHPWVFSGAIAAIEGAADAPGSADVVSASGEWLASGFFHPNADLAVRLYSWDRAQPFGPDLLAQRVREAVARRQDHLAAHGPDDSDAFRMVFSEADGVSGLIVDRYADTLSIRVSAKAIETWIDPILNAAMEACGVTHAVVDADPDAVEREGVDREALAARGTGRGPVCFRENGCQFEADPSGGQKTGFFLDQRDNRRRVAAWAKDRRMLSVYCYTGAFEVLAARAGAADIVGLDASETALAAARRHHELNATGVPVVYEAADAPIALRKYRDTARAFDLIVLDPPRFVSSRAAMDRGLRAYKDINLLAMKLLTPGGILATFSCSGLVSADEFLSVIRWAAVDARRDVRVVERLGQPFDHPILATVPESAYLKGCICRID